MPTTWSAPVITVGGDAAMVLVSILTSLLSAVRTQGAALAVAALVERASSDTPMRYPSLFPEAIDLLLLLKRPVLDAGRSHSG